MATREAHTPAMDKLVFTVQETADLLGLSDDLIYEHASLGGA